MGKLMKYDLRAAMRLFLPIWIGTLVLSVINAVAINTSIDQEHWTLNLLTNLTMIANVLLLVSVFVITLIYIVLRFYQSMLRDEGYLTFTLPVCVDSILWSKIFHGMILYAATFFVFITSIFILVSGSLSFDDLPYIWQSIMNFATEGEVVITVIFAVILALVGLITGLLQMYAAMAIGQLAKKQKVLASVAAYIGINIAISTAVSMIGTPALVRGVINWDNLLISSMREVHIVWLLMAVVLVANTALGTVFYFITRHMFSRKLNLE